VRVRIRSRSTSAAFRHFAGCGQIDDLTLCPEARIRESSPEGGCHNLGFPWAEFVFADFSLCVNVGGTAIPGVVWFVAILGGGLTIAFGSFFGAPSLRMHLAMSATLAASGAIMLILVIALSNPFRGDFRVSTEPFDRVLSQIEQSAL